MQTNTETPTNHKITPANPAPGVYVKEVRNLIIGDKFHLHGSSVNVLNKQVYGKSTRLTLMYQSDDAVVSVALRSARWVKTKREWF